MKTLTQWIGLGICLWFAVPLTAQEQATESASTTRYAYDTPLAKYGDLELGLGEFFYFQERMLKEIDSYQGAQRKELIDRALQTQFFENAIYHLAMEQGYGETAEYSSRVEDMQTGYLSAFYTYHQFTTQYEEDEETLREMYEDEKEKYFQPAKFTFRHIFVRTIDLPEEEAAQAKDRAQAALALIRNGSDFVEVAKMYSDSERKGAIVGPFNKRSYDEERAINPVLEDALMELKPGEVSEMISTKYGYEILKLETFTDDTYRPYEQLRLTLSNRRKTEARNNWKRAIVDEHWNAAAKEFSPGVILNESASPDEVIAVIYGRPLTLERYQQLAPQKLPRTSNESDEDYHQKLIDRLKYEIIFNQIAARLAYEMKYYEIPRYQVLTKFQERKSVFSVWWNKMIEDYVEANPVTEEERKAYYEENKQYFVGPSLSKVREMSFRVPEYDSDVMYEKFKAEEAAKNNAAEAIRRVQQGEDFAAVAKELSESDTANQGGDLGEIGFQTDNLPKMVAREAMKLAEGVITTEPVKDGEVFYVLQCYEKPPRQELAYDDPQSQDRLNRAVPNLKRNQYYQSMMDKIIQPEEIEVLFEEVYQISPSQIKQTGLYLPGEEPNQETELTEDEGSEDAEETSEEE